MKRLLALCYFVVFWFIQAYADYSDHGRPWDADENYDSSRGIWFVLFIIVIGVVVFIGAVAKHTWDNHKNSIKEGLGIVALFGICILLFLGGKACSEQNHKDNGHSTSVHQQFNPQQNLQDIQKQIQPQRQPQLHYRTEYYNETCPTCGGSRFIRCQYCDGKGYMKQTCQDCKGHGYKEVYKVVSAEFDPESPWMHKNPQHGYEQEYCLACFGKGYNEVKCNHCDNDYPYNTIFASGHTCPTCNGSGVVERSRQVPYYE